MFVSFRFRRRCALLDKHGIDEIRMKYTNESLLDDLVSMDSLHQRSLMLILDYSKLQRRETNKHQDNIENRFEFLSFENSSSIELESSLCLLF